MSNQPQNFTGAVGNFIIDSSISSDSVENGNPITFYLKLKGEGNLDNIGRPEVKFPDEFDVFDGEIKKERDITDSVSGAISWEYNLIPRREGDYIIEPVSIAFFDTQLDSWNSVKSNPVNLSVSKSSYIRKDFNSNQIADNRDIRYIKLDNPIWRTTNSNNIYNTSFFIIIGSIFILLAPLFIKPLNHIIENQSVVFKNKTALSNAIKILESSDNLYKDCPTVIRIFFKDKDLIDSINLDSLLLKDKVQDKIKLKDLETVESILDECSKYNYADISVKDNIKIQKKTIKVLTRINDYV